MLAVVKHALGLRKGFASITVVADIPCWFVTSSLSDLQRLDLLANFDDNTSSLMSWALSAKLRHGRDVPVVQHVVDIRHAQAGRIELN